MTTKLDSPGPGLHAVVIGVNRYRHLRNGGGDERTQYRGIDQLSSPVPSALRIARWLLNERVDATAPLRSLQVLVTSPDECAADLRGAGAICAAPTMDNIEKALLELKERGDEHPENKLLLYFCGHGLAFSGTDTLLTEDFGAKDANHFRHAINVDYLLGGMSNCRAESQLYLFDACRSDGTMFPPTPLVYGEPIINVSQLHTVDAKQVSIWASTSGSRAYGYTDGRPSVYAEAVLAALLGAAARKERSTYRIITSRLKEAIDAYVKARAPNIRQVADLRSSTLDFAIAELQTPPLVPVTIACEDANALPSTAFSYWSHPRGQGAPALDRRGPTSEPWHIAVATGVYDFGAEFVGKDPCYTECEEVVPPYANVSF